MNGFAARWGSAMILALGALMLAGALFVPAGYISVDEFVYSLGARTLAATGGFVFQNGGDLLSSPDLVFLTVLEGPNGMVPQYPIGPSLIGAPFIGLLGDRVFFIVNALAAMGVLFVTRALARAFYRDEALALGAVLILALATFLVDFAWGLWPHMIATLSVLTTALLAYRGVNAARGADTRAAFAAGLVLGAGFLFRLDSLLILGPIGVLALLYAPRPIRFGIAGLLGMIPGLAVAGWSNWTRFGTWNPLSYGRETGDTTITQHVPALAMVAAGLLLILAARQIIWRPAWRWPLIGAIAASLALAALTLTPARDLLFRYFWGAWVLTGDMTLSTDPRLGVAPKEDGIKLFFGLPKKALGQSLPWIGVLLYVFLRPWRAEDRCAHLFCLAMLGIWSLPFFMLEWHGGLGNNMRYLLPLLPILAILAGHGIRDLWAQAGGHVPLVPIFGAAGAALVLLWSTSFPGAQFGAFQIMPTYALIAMAALALVAVPAISGARLRAQVAGAGLAACLGIASAHGLVRDPELSAILRADSPAAKAEIAEVLGDTNEVLVYGAVRYFGFLLERPGAAVAFPASHREIDLEMIHTALDAGYDVYFTRGFEEEVIARDRSIRRVGPTHAADRPWAFHRVMRGELPFESERITGDLDP